MAKKSARILIILKCEGCGSENYTTQKNKVKQEKFGLRKFCKFCRKHTLHKEAKIRKAKK